MSTPAPWIEAEFHATVAPEIFSAAMASGQPVWIGIGGQPGAGKTAGRNLALELADAGSVASIVGDDLRPLHPDFERLMREDPLRMPERTQEAVSAWVELALEHAVDQRFSVLVEGTFRRPEVTIGTAERFHDAGYRTHLVAVAVPGWESRLSTVERFVTDHREGRTARWTPPAAHDAGLTGSPSTLRAAASSTAVDRISVVTRRGQLLFDGARPGDLSPAAAVLRREQRRMPAAAVLREWQHRYRAVVEYIEREVPRSAATTDSLRALRAEAVTLERAGREAGRPATGPQLAPGRGASL